VNEGYLLLLYLSKWLQRSRILEIDKKKEELPRVAMFVNGSGQNEQFL
jgi:hypothetical protein